MEHLVNCNWSWIYVGSLSLCKCMRVCVCVSVCSPLRFMVVGWGLGGMTLSFHVEGTDLLHLPSRVIMRDTNVQWCFLPPGIRHPSIRLCQPARLTRRWEICLKIPVRTFQSLGVGWGMLKAEGLIPFPRLLLEFWVWFWGVISDVFFLIKITAA